MSEYLKPNPVTRSEEYKIAKGYVKDAFLEERKGRPLTSRQDRLAGFVARYLGMWSEITEKRPEKLEDLEGTIKRAGYGVDGLSWMAAKSQQLMPGWMESKKVASAIVTLKLGGEEELTRQNLVEIDEFFRELDPFSEIAANTVLLRPTGAGHRI